MCLSAYYSQNNNASIILSMEAYMYWPTPSPYLHFAYIPAGAPCQLGWLIAMHSWRTFE